MNIDLNVKPIDSIFSQQFTLQVMGRAGFMEIATDTFRSVSQDCEGISNASNMTLSTVEDSSEADTKNTSKVPTHDILK